MATDGESADRETGDGAAAGDAAIPRPRPRPRGDDPAGRAEPDVAGEPRVDLEKPPAAASDPVSDEPFDPYRFGKPDFPVPPEFAPPGYVPDPPAVGAAPYGGPPPSNPYAGGPGSNPYAGPYGPGAPYPPYAPPYAPGPYARQGGGSGKAVASLACGIGSIVLCFLSFLDGILVVLAVIFGIIALNEIRSRGLTGKGMAVAGLVCAAVGAVLAIVLTVFFVRAYNDCGGSGQQNDPAFQRCVQERLF